MESSHIQQEWPKQYQSWDSSIDQYVFSYPKQRMFDLRIRLHLLYSIEEIRQYDGTDLTTSIIFEIHSRNERLNHT